MTKSATLTATGTSANCSSLGVSTGVDHHLAHARRDVNLGYFFVARRFRGRGVGAAAFGGLLARYPGAWELYYLARNAAAAGFWPRAFERAGVRDVVLSDVTAHGEACVMHRFVSPHLAG